MSEEGADRMRPGFVAGPSRLRPGELRRLFLVPSEYHVERFIEAGHAAETLDSLERRLAFALFPDRSLASPSELRMAVSASLQEAAEDEELLGGVRREGALAWERTVDAVEEAIQVVRASGALARELTAIARKGGLVGKRAGLLAGVIASVDRILATASLVDELALPSLLAQRIARFSPDAVISALGAEALETRLIVDLSGARLGLLHALERALSARGGHARVVLPTFDRPLDSEREPDPLEQLTDEVARALDAAPGLEPIAPRLGDLRFAEEGPSVDPSLIEVRVATDAEAQAKAVAEAVDAALAAGIPSDKIAIAIPRASDDSLLPLRRVLDEVGVVTHAHRPPSPLATGVMAFALSALSVGESLGRSEVSALLRSPYVDARQITGGADGLSGRRALEDLSSALARTESAFADTPARVLEETARRSGRLDVARREARAGLARRVAEGLTVVPEEGTRPELVRAIRGLFAWLGTRACVGRGARAAFLDDAPALGPAKAELLAVARDAAAWEAFEEVLEAVDSGARRLGLAGRRVTRSAFLHEVARALRPEQAEDRRPCASRAGAVRLGSFEEFAGEPLELLVVVDANDGVLPSPPPASPMLPDELADALGSSPRSECVRELACLALAAHGARRIVVTTRTSDRSDAPLAAAALVPWLLRAGVAASSWSASPTSGRPLTPRMARLEALAAAPALAPSLAPSAAARAAVEGEREAFFLDPRRPASPIVGDISPDPALIAALEEESGTGEAPLPVTQLEDIAACRFRGFAHQVLGAKGMSEEPDLPDAREEGNRMHAALAAALAAVREELGARPRAGESILAAAESAALAYLRGRGALHGLSRIVDERVLNAVRSVVARAVADEEWNFEVAEQAFGEKDDQDSWPALELDLDDARVRLRGRIDRVDLSHLRAEVRAIDYKRSGTKLAHLGVTILQVPLYARAAGRATSRCPKSGAYLSLHPSELAEDSLASRKLAARIEGLLEEPEGRASALDRAVFQPLLELRRGALLPRPHEESTCRYCRVDGGCRKPRFAMPAEDEPLGDGAPPSALGAPEEGAGSE